MNRATVYIVILGIVCTGLGIAGGIALEKRYTARNFPRIAKSQLFGYSGERGMQGMHQRRMQDFHQKGMQGVGPREGQEPSAANVCERLNQTLNLSSEQTEKIEAILEQSKKEIEQARDGFKTQLGQVREKSHSQILEVLNPEQKEKFEELRSKMKEGKGQRRLRRMQ